MGILFGLFSFVFALHFLDALVGTLHLSGEGETNLTDVCEDFVEVFLFGLFNAVSVFHLVIENVKNLNNFSIDQRFIFDFPWDQFLSRSDLIPSNFFGDCTQAFFIF